MSVNVPPVSIAIRIVSGPRVFRFAFESGFRTLLGFSFRGRLAPSEDVVVNQSEWFTADNISLGRRGATSDARKHTSACRLTLWAVHLLQ